MAEQTQWEYRAQRFGSLFREAKAEDLEATLGEWGAEGLGSGRTDRRK